MSLYAIDQRVWVKSEQSLGTITEAFYAKSDRKAAYMVKLADRPIIYLTGSSNLRAANWCCDGCGRWLRGTHYRADYDRDGVINVALCFLCIEALPRQLREIRDAYGGSYHP